MKYPRRVYFAGKVSRGGGYRGILLNDPLVMSQGHIVYQLGDSEIIYGGPFALDSLFHRGSFHDYEHGMVGVMYEDNAISGIMVDANGHNVEYCSDHCGIYREEAVDRCIKQIQSCDCVHVYIDDVTCYGTIAEIGYASAINKPIYIFYSKDVGIEISNLWFCFNLPNVICAEHGTPKSFHPDLLPAKKTYRQKYHEYLKSKEWNSLRVEKLKEAGFRCQLCNKSDKLNVHHRTYDRVFNESLSDLIALCSGCHEKFHLESASLD